MEEVSITSKMAEMLSSDVLSGFGSIASTIGVILTIFVLLSLRKIRSQYIFAARVPELIEKLSDLASDISECMNDFDTFIPQISLDLGEAEVVLKSLRKKLRRKSRKSIDQLLKNMDDYNANTGDSDKLWGVYVDMSKVIAEVKDIQEDLKWER